ncbi:hypothetical protein [Rhizobium fabae]|uniref:Uncharacterized protein n=1 Tax=Rhizobium fabae TaxID=573179 RepID=A0A7W6BGG6_9HYPH|nr:hypothetical protein [Rhizobium fabae]MBB3918692.1 hypothetical protein [Rhizobium fabae]
MKTPQRKFVVEYKLGRRRSTTQPDSIWGNTDLKAFVRQAETEAPHLFESKTGLDALGLPGGMPQDQQSVNQLNKSDNTSNQNQLAASLTEAVQIGSSRTDHGSVSSISRSKKHAVKRRARGAATRVDERRLENHVDVASDEHGKEPATTHVEAPIDELAALDAENRQLKALLIRHLHQENLQLRKMLERFGVS